MLEGLKPFVLSTEVAGFKFDAATVQRAQVALDIFQTAAESWVTQQLQLVETVVATVSIEGAGCSTAPIEALRRRAQRERKRIEAHMMKVSGNDILEADESQVHLGGAAARYGGIAPLSESSSYAA